MRPSYEYGVLVLDGTIDLDGRRLEDRSLYYLGTRRSETSFASSTGGRLLLIGGPPFPETILMWWNFVARSGEEITRARDDWERNRRFGDVPAYDGPRLQAPALTRFTRPDPLS
jgi:redox-sensitive bicupin YhaK (pirin superfamily)